ncbi:MAG: class B sortase [Christensenellaceae bacterium]|nr:class B sortase [Christensenellaceae bacterium]
MSKRIKMILTAALVFIILIAAVFFIRNLLNYYQGNNSYEEALEITQNNAPNPSIEPKTSIDPLPDITPLPTDPPKVWIPAPIDNDDPIIAELEHKDISGLQQINKDVVGWIFIPDTKINYPIVHGENNEFYLEHTWKKQKNRMGSVFIECENTSDFTEWNTIIYAHNMKNGSMFGSLKKYKDQEYFEDHPYVYIAVNGGVLRYEIFSAYTADVDSQTFGLSYHQIKTRKKLLDLAMEKSVIDTGVIPEVTDQIITLSTCSGETYETRQVIHARLPMIQIEE